MPLNPTPMRTATERGRNISATRDYIESKSAANVSHARSYTRCYLCGSGLKQLLAMKLQHFMRFIIFVILITCSRERNRMHARKTRERKKQQSNAMQTRLNELEDEVLSTDYECLIYS